MEKWQIGTFILIFLMFGMIFVAYSEINSVSSGSADVAATCPTMQYVINESSNGFIGCLSASNTNYLTTQTAVSTEVAATCATNQYAQNESSGGSFGCNQVQYTQVGGFPAYCNAGQFISGLNPINCIPPTTDFRTGLTLYYPFDFTGCDTLPSLISASTCTYDLSGYSNYGKLVSSPTLVNGLFGSAMNFSGSNYVSSNRTVYSTSFTVTFWVKFSTVAGYQTVVSNENTSDIGWRIHDANNGANMEFLVYIGSGFIAVDVPTISANKWYFVAASYSPVNLGSPVHYLNNGALLFVNGTTAFSSNSGTPINTKTPLFCVGGNHCAGINEGCSCYVDEMRYYNWAMSSIQMTSQFQYYWERYTGL